MKDVRLNGGSLYQVGLIQNQSMTSSVCVCRFLGVQLVFVGGALLSFLLTIVVLTRRSRQQETAPQSKGGYELVNGRQRAEKELET